MSNSRVLECPHCGFETPYGLTVCKGCQAEIVYGATSREELGYGCLGGIIGTTAACMLTTLLNVVVAGLLISTDGKFGSLGSSGSFLLYSCSFLVLIIAGVVGGVKFIRTKKSRSDVRFFRKYEAS